MTHTITATYSTAVSLSSGTDQPTTITAAARLNDGLVVSYTDLTVVNAGTISFSNFGVTVTAGGSVTNQSGGAISGYGGIIDEGSIALTVVNAGRIAASGNRSTGVDLIGGAGSVTNQSGGTISGFEGIYADSALTVENAGRITGSSLGVDLLGGGSVTNQSGGAISGLIGIYGWNVAVTVVNAGTISSSGGGGVRVFSSARAAASPTKAAARSAGITGFSPRPTP